MKYSFILLLIGFSFSVFGQERYFLVDGSELNEASYQKAIASNNYLDIDIEKGELNGKFNNGSFLGYYGVVSTSIGFEKGFKYRMALGYLQRDVINDPKFVSYTQALANGKGFYFYPDVLAAPTWHFLEVSSANSETLRFVRKH